MIQTIQTKKKTKKSKIKQPNNRNFATENTKWSRMYIIRRLCHIGGKIAVIRLFGGFNRV